MATICFTLSASDLAVAVDALSVRWGYESTIDGAPNPQTKGEFVRQEIARWIKREVRSHRLATAQAAITVNDVEVS